MYICLQIKDSTAAKIENTGCFEDLDQIIAEANLVKTAVGSSLPIGWLAETDGSINDSGSDSSREKLDFVSAAGFEMVELLILAAQILKDLISQKKEGDGD